MYTRTGVCLSRGRARVTHRPIPWRATSRAFTLIEVLVVVAIIALLTAVLLPSLSRARDASRAVVCGAHLKHGAESAFMWIQHLQGRRMPTNSGWAVGALRMAQGQTGIFTCPSDPRPTPIPAILVDMFDGGSPMTNPYGTASPDGPFNRINPPPPDGGAGSFNIQDEIRGCYPGGDNDPVDVEFSYIVANKGATTTEVTLTQVSAGTNFAVRDYKGRTLIANVKSPDQRTFVTPVMRGSYGLNVSAGCRAIKGNPILLAEYNGWGIKPETINPNFPVDNLKANMRFRHGGNASEGAGLLQKNARTGAVIDPSYVPKERANVAFLDLHVERLPWDRVVRQIEPTGLNYTASSLAPFSYTSLWLGSPAPRPPGWGGCCF